MLVELQIDGVSEKTRVKKIVKLCKCLARQGVWIIACTVKTQPLLKITSGMSERATLHEGGKGEGKEEWGTIPHQWHRSNAHTDARDRAHFHRVFAIRPTSIFFRTARLSQFCILHAELFSSKFYSNNSNFSQGYINSKLIRHNEYFFSTLYIYRIKRTK